MTETDREICRKDKHRTNTRNKHKDKHKETRRLSELWESASFEVILDYKRKVIQCS